MTTIDVPVTVGVVDAKLEVKVSKYAGSIEIKSARYRDYEISALELDEVRGQILDYVSAYCFIPDDARS